jgi:hypothetical protein
MFKAILEYSRALSLRSKKENKMKTGTKNKGKSKNKLIKK